MCLNDLRRGQSATIGHIPDDSLRTQLMRFGIIRGSRVLCHTHIPFGPVVLRFGNQEIALGRDLARRIAVSA